MKRIRRAIALAIGASAAQPLGAYAQGSAVVQSSAQGFTVESPTAAQDPNNHPPRIDTSYPNRQPPYPVAAQINGEQGNIVLNLRVATNGKVRAVEVVRSSGFADLDNAAVEGAFNLRFIPATEDGDTVTAWTKVTITYQLPTAIIIPPKGTPAAPRS